MSRNCDKPVGLADNPLLTVLGRRGRGAVIAVLRDTPARPWNVRDLARAADVNAMTASRTVKELSALGVVESYRPGRDLVVRWRASSAGAAVIAALDPPDLLAEGCRTFAGAYSGPHDGPLRRWFQPGDQAADPLVPARLAVLVATDADEDEAWDAVGPALDAVEAAGWARPEVGVQVRTNLDEGDAVAAAILAGRPL